MLRMHPLQLSFDRYTYAKCSNTNLLVNVAEEEGIQQCCTCNQDDFVHAKHHQSNSGVGTLECKNWTNNNNTHNHKDSCKSCLKSQCTKKKKYVACCQDDSNCVNYVYNFQISKCSKNDEKSVYFVYHVSHAIYKFLLHFKFRFSICMTYVTLDRFISRLIMLYLVHYQSHVLIYKCN